MDAIDYAVAAGCTVGCTAATLTCVLAIEDGFTQATLNWTPLAYDDDNQEYFLNIAMEEEVPIGPIPPGLVAATVLRLTRNLAF